MTKPFVRTFRFFGVDLTDNTLGESQGDCPFCGKAGHFSVNNSTGQWGCWVCSRSGNIYTFLRQWYEFCKYQPQKPLAELAALRGIPKPTLEHHGLIWDTHNDRWMFPVWRPSNDGKLSLVNLKVWGHRGESRQLMGAPNCAHHLYNLQHLKPKGTIYICEGEWDCMATEDLVVAGGYSDSPPSVVAVPGANVFKPEWAGYFAGRDIVFLYDNDSAGQTGVSYAINRLSGNWGLPKSISRLNWPARFPNKYDMRDLTIELGCDCNTWNYLKMNLEQVPLPEQELSTRTHWNQVLDDYSKVWHMDKGLEDAITISAAVSLSAKIPGDPLWLFLVGPPSTGKTVVIESLAMDPVHHESLSKLTSKSLISGWKDEANPDHDVSIFPLLQGRCLLVKDYTAVLSLPGGTQEELYGMLRDAYDGRVRVIYGHGKVVDYKDTYFSMVAGVTDVIREDNRSDLGERFLKIEICGDDYDPEAAARAALETTTITAERSQALKLLSQSLTNYLDSVVVNNNDPRFPTISEDYKTRIVNLGLVVGMMRAVVPRNGDEILYRPRPEGASRVSKQLARLGQALCLLLKKPCVDEEVYRLIRKTALDTVRGYMLEIAHRLITHQLLTGGGMTTDEITDRLQLAKTTVVRKLKDLQALGAITSEADTDHDEPGRKPIVWTASEPFLEMWRQAGLNQRRKMKAK